MSGGVVNSAREDREERHRDQQTLQLALAAELIEIASWEMMIAMAETMGRPDGKSKQN